MLYSFIKVILSRISVNTIKHSAILSDLKRETQACHAELERSVDFLSRVRNASGYRNLLEIFYGVFRPIEADLWKLRMDMVKWLPDLEPRMRSAALRADLAVLGNRRPGDLPLAAVPSLSSLPARFGCLYVLEGSTLGGQFISRHIAESLTYTPQNGCAFFRQPRRGSREYVEQIS